jgi:hypothetical protein
LVSFFEKTFEEMKTKSDRFRPDAGCIMLLEVKIHAVDRETDQNGHKGPQTPPEGAAANRVL